MSEQKEVKNQEMREYGQMELADNRQQHKLHLLSIIGEVEGMNVCLPIQRQRNMNMYCQNWHRWRMTGRSTACWCC